MGVNVLYAGLFTNNVAGLKLHNLPSALRERPDYFNSLRGADIGVVTEISRERYPIEIEHK